MNTHAPLLQQREGPVLQLQLNRPDKGNALSPELVLGLTEAIENASQDPSIRLLVLSGQGRHFCTGFDLSDLDQQTDDSLLARFTRVELMLQALHAAPMSTLALAHGRTMGAGADLFAACRERWIVGDARFAFPGAAFGLVLGSARLSALVGAPQAADWIESGILFDSDSACRSGLATRRIEAETLAEARAALAQRSSRLDLPTQQLIGQAIAAGRHGHDASARAADLARLVRSAARPGLRERIAAYRAAQTQN